VSLGGSWGRRLLAFYGFPVDLKVMGVKYKAKVTAKTRGRAVEVED